MQVTTEQPDPCTLVMDVSVDEQQVARAFESSFREFGKYANVPGFRPGKAPRAIVERFVDGERVRQHTLEKIIRETYPEAAKEQGAEPYRDPHFDPTDLEDKKPFSYKVTIPLEPQVTIGPYTGLTVEKPVFSVTDEMVGARLDRMREDKARLERVSDRGVEQGDVLIGEVGVTPEGQEEPATPRRQLIQMGGNIPGYDEALIGMETGEEKTFTLTYPEDFTDEESRGKSAQFFVKVISISSKRLPDLDDDFAKSLGNSEGLESLKSSIRARLEQDAVRLSDEVAEQRLFEQIVNASEIHFPAVLAQEEVEDRLRQFAHDLRQHNVSYAQYLAQSGMTQEDHQAGLFAEAESKIRAILALREVAKIEKLDVDNAAIDAEFARMLESGAITDEQYEEFATDQRRRFQIANALIQQRLHEFLFSSNTLIEVAQESSAAS